LHPQFFTKSFAKYQYKITYGWTYETASSVDEPLKATIIDFGDVFIASEIPEWHKRNPHPYLAPERLGIQQYYDEQVDVYSFGMLLMWLAIGIAEQPPAEFNARQRRNYFKQKIHKINFPLVRDEPRILDIITLCTAFDPSDRPRMTDVCADLTTIANAINPDTSTRSQTISSMLSEISNDIAKESGRQSPILLGILERQIHELREVVKGLKTEMVELRGTRCELLRALVSLVDNLKENDSWTTLTTPSVWQSDALGLNGRYLSSNLLAIKRGVAIRRTFLVSVEELGIGFTERLVSLLEKSNDRAMAELAEKFSGAISDYKHATSKASNYQCPIQSFEVYHQERFILILETMRDFVNDLEDVSDIFPGGQVDISKSKGLYYGICPVSTLNDAMKLRSENPASLIRIEKETEESKKWLLVITTIRRRKENHREMARSQLLGVRVHKSVMVVPNDRIINLQRVMNDHSICVGHVAVRLGEIACALREEFMIK
jgi:hypothetical protein